MTTQSSDDDHARLLRLGLTEDEADALVLLWDTDLIEHVLHPSHLELRWHGFSAADAFDASWHKLDADEWYLSLAYLSRGYTPHQGWLIENEPYACRNLYMGRDEHAVQALLGLNGVPRQHIVNILLTAKSPEEAEDQILRYRRAARGIPMRDTHGGYDTTADLEAGTAIVAALLPEPHCDCGERRT